ncbi:MAG: hypothetical protein NTX09_01970 [Verrucomicrobia bacterium]|nr:hypothetical protein [Verrucomicrobiota bacterium]
MSSARRLLAASAVAIVAVVSITAATLAKQIPGQSSFGTERYVDDIAGDRPIVLASPHRGRLKSAPLRDHADGVITLDAITEALARASPHLNLIASQRFRINQ